MQYRKLLLITIAITYILYAQTTDTITFTKTPNNTGLQEERKSWKERREERRAEREAALQKEKDAQNLGIDSANSARTMGQEVAKTNSVVENLAESDANKNTKTEPSLMKMHSRKTDHNATKSKKAKNPKKAKPLKKEKHQQPYKLTKLGNFVVFVTTAAGIIIGIIISIFIGIPILRFLGTSGGSVVQLLVAPIEYLFKAPIVFLFWTAIATILLIIVGGTIVVALTGIITFVTTFISGGFVAGILMSVPIPLLNTPI